MASGFAKMLLRISCCWCGLGEQEFPGGQWGQGAAPSLWHPPGCRGSPTANLGRSLQAAQEPHTRDTIVHLPPLSELSVPLWEC